MTKIETYTAAALDLLNAGFASKAGQKRALDEVARAFDEVKRSISGKLLADRDLAGGKEGDWNDLYYGPLNLHEFTAKKVALYSRFDVFADDLAVVAQLHELRDAIKSAPIVAAPKNETKVLANRVIESIKDLMARRNAQFLEAIDLATVLGDDVRIAGLSANTHYVTNEGGTTFLRTFFYLRGKLTPLNSILAGVEEAVRQAEAAK